MYKTEREGQIQFYTDYLKRIDKSLSIDDILEDNTDGVLNGNIIEFKLNINDVNSTLFQSIKYLSSMRIKGKSIPKNILLISLNQGIAYLYDSSDYIADIEKVYIGSASKGNEGFCAKSPSLTLDYLNNPLESEGLIKILKETEFTKINIDENCIVGWAERFYRENQGAKKSRFYWR